MQDRRVRGFVDVVQSDLDVMCCAFDHADATRPGRDVVVVRLPALEDR